MYPNKEGILSTEGNCEASNQSGTVVKHCFTKKEESSASTASVPETEKKMKTILL
jgi:hypothetical protein